MGKTFNWGIPSFSLLTCLVYHTPHDIPYYTEDLINECSYIIEFIKRIGERDIIHLFRNEFNKFNNK